MLLTSLLLSAAPAYLPTPQDQGARDLIVLYSAGGETCFADPKDQAFLRALKLLPARIAELPAEIPDFPPLPPDAMPLLGRILGGPITLRIGSVPPDPAVAAPPFYGQLTLPEADAEAAGRLFQSISNMLSMTGMPVNPDDQGRVQLPGAPLPIWFGAEGTDFVLAAGFDDGGRVEPGFTGLPAGVPADFACNIEYGQIMKIFFEMIEMYGGGEEVAMNQAIFENLGLYDLSFQVAAGKDDSRSYSVLRIPSYVGSMREQGLLPARTINEADLKRIPADAVFASVTTTNLGGTLDALLTVIEQGMAEAGMGGDPLEMLAGMTGIHLRTDLVDYIGSTFGLYTSDTTGGGGIMSAVYFFEVLDEEGLTDTKERILGMLGQILGQQSRGYVSFRDWEDQGIDYTTLTFPGLPVPLEITGAISDGYAYIGLTPQAVMGAIYQARSGEKSLLDNPRFREQLAGGVDGLMAVSFLDMPRMISDGYSVMSLLASALRNGTRSRLNEDRDAGMILPAYPLLVKGAKATVSATRADGDDWVVESRGDRSFIVNLTSGIGAVASSPIGLAAIAAVGIAVAEEQGGMSNW